MQMDINPNKGELGHWLKNNIIQVMMDLLSASFCWVEWQIHRWQGQELCLWGAHILIREMWGRSWSSSFWDLPFPMHRIPPWGPASSGSHTPLAKGWTLVPKWEIGLLESKLWTMSCKWLELTGPVTCPWKITIHSFLPSGYSAFSFFLRASLRWVL